MGIDRSKYGSQGGESKPKLTADMIPAPKTVLTISEVFEVNETVAITFAEFPDHTFWTNKTQQDAFIEAVDAGKLPDDWKGMRGARVPFYKKQNTNPETLEKVWKLYPMPVELWDDALAAFDKASRAQAAPAATPARAAAPAGKFQKRR